MPIFTFEGFTEGSLVAMSAAQGGQGAAGSVPEWRLSNMNTATIDIAPYTQTEVVAPAVVWFEATGFAGFNVEEPANSDGGRAYDPTAHDITHIWDFDDAGTFGDHLNIPTAWRQSGVDYGKKAVHVFGAGRNYGVRLWSVDRDGTIGERTIPVFVEDPDVLYSGPRTICVSNQSDWTGAPSGAQQVTTIAAARTALAALGQTGRILLMRGEEYTESFSINSDLDNVHIGAFGAGADPIWRPVSSITSSGICVSVNSNITTAPDITIWGIDFRGEWDATLETGDPRQAAISFSGFDDVHNWNAVLYKCRFDGFSGHSWSQGGTSHRVAVVDCEITNTRSYGIGLWGQVYGLDKRFAMVGTSVMQPQNGCAGRPGTGDVNSLSNEYACIRNEGENEMILSACSFYSCLSRGFQQCLRLFSAGDGNPGGQFLNASRIVCEGGVAGVKLGGQNSGTPERPGNFIFDMCLFVQDYSTRLAIQASYGGVTMRNILAVVPNITTFEQDRVGAFSFQRDNTGGENDNAKRQIYNCTVLNLSSDDYPLLAAAWTGGLTDLTTNNNVQHEPNLGTPNTPDAPIDLTETIAGYVTRSRGRRLSPTKVAQSISVTSGNSFTVAYPAGTGQSDYNAAGRHTVMLGGLFDRVYLSYKGNFSVSFGALSITVTNTSGQTWSGTAAMSFERSNLTTETAYGSPLTVPLSTPTGTRSPDGPLQARTQFDTFERVRVLGAV